MGAVFFFGSRSLGAAFAAPVSAVVARALARVPAGPFVVGCAAGADALVLSALLAAGAAPRSVVCAAGAASGAGFWSGSAPFASLLAAGAAGASVRWLAGGDLRVPLRARLFARSSAAVALAASAGPGGLALGFLASPDSRGSLFSARAALAAGLSVFVFCAFAGPPAPVPGCSWVCVPAGPFASCWFAVSAQAPLF